MNKFIVMTTIFEPSKATRMFASMPDWQLVVVADRKTPVDWNCENAIFLSTADQLRLGYPLVEHLPWNHYARKMIGYLYAMEHGAELIADVDDDNIPLPHWDRHPRDGEFDAIMDPGFVNVYRFFTDEFIWPRGFPMDELQSTGLNEIRKSHARVGVWQFLANNDPDVDAVYRMLFNKSITFREREPIVLDQGAFCPFNSQNTLVVEEAFPVLYLPALVSFRFTDILRGIVAQPLLWASGLRLAFASATVIQERNPHDGLKDFESEIPAYLQTKKAAYIAAETVGSEKPALENLLRVYGQLAQYNIVPPEETEVCKSWIESLELVLARRPH